MNGDFFIVGPTLFLDFLINTIRVYFFTHNYTPTVLPATSLNWKSAGELLLTT